MGFVDFILNLAGLLLWIKWRSLPFDPIHKRVPATLVGTLRPATKSHFRRWHLLAGIGLLLVLRAAVYQWIGSAIHWTGRLDLGFISFSFRSDRLDRMFLFSAASFGLSLGIFYVWLLLLSLLNGRVAAAEPVHRLVRVQLGRIDTWPSWVKLLLPFAGAGMAWWLASWLLVWLEIIPQPLSTAHRLESAVVIGLGSYLAWKSVAAALLCLHLLHTYVYFGKHPIWNYVDDTARRLLAPLKPVPLDVGRVDFAPVVGMVILFLAAEMAEHSLVWLYGRLPL